MIRAAWVLINSALATLFFGPIAIVASLLGMRGRIYFWITREWSRAILWASGTRVLVHGMERIDWSRPHVLVANHVSFYDVFALAAVLPTPFAFVGKKELARIPLFGTAWTAAGHISVDRSNRQSALRSLRAAADTIRRHNSNVIIFPEGTRSRTGELLPFKKGAFALALEAEVPVVPVAILGSEEILESRPLRVHARPVHLHFGEPVWPEALAGDGVERIMAAVRTRLLELLSAPPELPPVRLV